MKVFNNNNKNNDTYSHTVKVLNNISSCNVLQLPPFCSVLLYFGIIFNNVHQWFCSLHCYMSLTTIACYDIVH